MTLLSRKADYALLILSYLHHHPGSASAREVADHYGISQGFTANILKELCHKEFVTSHRGAKGGYTLARPAAGVSLAELLESLEDGFRLAACSEQDHAEDMCSLTGVCPLRTPIGAVHERITEVLRSISLLELFPEATPPVALASLQASLPLIAE